MIELMLPWPPSELSPNKRLHWSTVARHKKSYRTICFGITCEQAGLADCAGGNLHLTLEFCPPNRRSYDRDNLVARMKSGIDGIADALRINDRQFTTLTARLDPCQIGGFVRVSISEDKQ